MKKNYRMFKVILSAIALSGLSSCAMLSSKPEKPLCADTLNSPIANFCQVEKNVFWRGAQPKNKEQAAWLIEKGVKTIINLELLHSDLDKLSQAPVAKDKQYQIDYFSVKTWEPLYAFDTSEADEDVVHFLAVASQAKKPFYVHCRAGENRTGVMVAAYKIIIENKTSPDEIKAILEELRSYKGIWSDFTVQYVEQLSPRRDEFLQMVKKFKQPKQIICDNGQCKTQ